MHFQHQTKSIVEKPEFSDIPDVKYLDSPSDLANLIEEFLEREGLTSEEFAQKCGVSRKQIDNIIRSRSADPKLNTVIAILRAMKARLAALKDWK